MNIIFTGKIGARRAPYPAAALKSCAYGLKYVIGHRLFGKTAPLIRGLVLTNRCNLRCRHCKLDVRGAMHLDFAEAVAAINAFHREGGRCLYLEGGEPFLWHDGQQGLDDVVGYLSYAEIDQTLKLKPSALLNAMNYF